MKKIALILTLTPIMFAGATDTSNTITEKPGKMTISGYIETYYSYDFGNPSSHERPGFFYSYNRHNEVNLNIGFIKANYTSENVRSNFALMGGTYSQYNLSGEQGLLKNIFEANAGVKLSKNKNIWMDMGIMPSHIGFESAIGKDCWNITRSILADNSPYYESGLKFGYTSENEKLYIAAMYLNGWQRIQRIPFNQTPAFGTQLTYKPNSDYTFNWSTFIGNEQADTAKKWRYFSNLYATCQVSPKIGIIAGLDYGLQQKRDTLNKLDGMSSWYTPVLIFRYEMSPKLFVSVRGEYYDDKDGVIISTGTPNGFQTFGYSVNFDYKIKDNLLWRIECRNLQCKDKIFMDGNYSSNSNLFSTTSLAISF